VSRAKAKAPKSEVREFLEAVVVALVLAMFIRTFFVQAFKIPSGSMLPTLQIGDHLLVNKLLYGLRVPIVGTRYFDFFEPERGDIIVFVFPGDPNNETDYIKRVIGVPGDVIEIRQKKLYRNGELVDEVDEPYAQYLYPSQTNRKPRDNFGPETVPERHVFVLGDNRDSSSDSRFWGFVPFENIKGKAFIIYASFDGDQDWADWIRFNRIGSLVR